MPFERLNTLKNLLDMYKYRDEDVCVNEAIANAVDAFRENSILGGKIDITFDRTDDYGYITFHNNAPPMTKDQFITKYHTVSFSFKKKGQGIGFAGVGAKLFLASEHGGEIITITGKGKSNFMASKMEATETDLDYGTTFKNSLSEIIGKKQYSHSFGTTYRVRLSLFAYKYLKEHLEDIVQFWWNYALLTKQITITVDGKVVRAWEPKGTKFQKQIKWKKNIIKCFYWIADELIPEERQHIVYSVFGKRIHRNKLDVTIRIKEDYAQRIFCIADLSVLAGYLTANKEEFEVDWRPNECKSVVKKAFWDFLEKEGLLSKSDPTQITSPTFVNELTKRLDKILQTDKFKHLNIFLSTTTRNVLTPDETGDTPITESTGEGGTGEEGGEGPGVGPGRGEGIAHVEDEKGLDIGKAKPRKARGLQITLRNWPEEPQESWVSPEEGAIIINEGHEFWIRHRTKSTETYNFTRILLEAIIKYKSKENTWTPEETLQQLDDLLHEVW